MCDKVTVLQQGCHLAVFPAKFEKFGRIEICLAVKKIMSPAKYIWSEIWPYESCLAVKLKFWPNTSFQYNIFSLAALKKSLAASGYDVEKNNSCLKLVLRSLVTKGTLLQIKGTGALGSKLNKKWADPKDKATCKQQPAGAKKTERAAGSAGAKKAVKKPASVAAKKPKSPAKPLKAKAQPKAKPTPEKK
uniref:H15 domain-containing protein n=1 Tax=Laticauda laticaudata TaxID=8630 RepID=A0A8C5S0H3_LATLA